MQYRFLFFSLFISITACSVYKSTGRSSFENRAPGNLSAASLASLEAEDLPNLKNETCWNQPSNEPLWNMDSDTGLSELDTKELFVKRITPIEIQVCTRPID